MLEVMVVVAIIGIVAAIATPNFGPMLRGQKLQAKAEEVASFLDRARRDAFASGRCVKVRIEDDKLVAGRKSDATAAANCFQVQDGAAITGDFDTLLPLPVEKDTLTLT
ncbi:MAG: hypothetical protein ACO3JL_15865, partial [Myxococcota bacterium]